MKNKIFHGEVHLRISMPLELRQDSKRFILAQPDRKYVFLVIATGGIGNRNREVLEAVSFNQSSQYHIYSNHLSLILNFHTHAAMGKLAPRFGIWSVEVAPSHCRGMMRVRSEWVVRGTGTHPAMKYLLNNLILINKKNHVNYQKIFRLVLKGTMFGTNPNSSYHFNNDEIVNYFQ